MHAQSRGFSADELRALDQGRIVLRRTQQGTGSGLSVGGTSFQAVNRQQEDVWRAVQDINNYRYMLPSTRSARVVARQPNTAVLRVEHGAGPVSAVYHLRIRFAQDVREVRFDLDPSRPHDIHSARGFLVVRPYPGDPERTMIMWGALVGVGDGLFASVIRPQVHEWLLRVPETMRAYLEGRARDWYVGQNRT